MESIYENELMPADVMLTWNGSRDSLESCSAEVSARGISSLAPAASSGVDRHKGEGT